MKQTEERSFLPVLEENYQAQIAGYYNHDKTDAERAKRNAVIEEYENLISIYKARFPAAQPINGKDESYPGKDYQRLFSHLMNSFQVVALQSEMQEIIEIVHEDFPGWISVETIPDCGHYIAAYFNPNDSIKKMYVLTAWRGRNGWYWDNAEKEKAEDSTLKITHYMPLPSPPKI